MQAKALRYTKIVFNGDPWGSPAIGVRMSVIELTQDTFQEATKADQALIIDFWAPWCGPCRQFGPIFEAAAAKHADVTFAKINTEEQPELATALRIRSIPTIMVFRENVLLFQQAGALAASQLDELVTQVKAVDMAQVHAQIAAQEGASSTKH